MLNAQDLEKGQDQYENFKHRNCDWVQYDYRDLDGELFTCIKKTLGECWEACRLWKESRKA